MYAGDVHLLVMIKYHKENRESLIDAGKEVSRSKQGDNYIFVVSSL
jgi:hypothetical protein